MSMKNKLNNCQLLIITIFYILLLITSKVYSQNTSAKTLHLLWKKSLSALPDSVVQNLEISGDSCVSNVRAALFEVNREKLSTRSELSPSAGKYISRVSTNSVIYRHNEYSNDSLLRQTSIHYIIEKNNSVLFAIQDSLQESMSRETAIQLENRSASCLPVVIPQKRESWFETLAEPIILITSAATTIILLFTLRSH